MDIPVSTPLTGSGFLAQASLFTAAALLSVGVASQALADTVRLQGATTVLNVVVNPHRAAVEQATGHTLEITGNATGKGLVALLEGKADVSMCSEPLDFAVDAAVAAGTKVDAKALQFHTVFKDEIVFIVHPANPVTKLSWEQVRDIHMGKIANWKEVGGKDQAITVYIDAPTGATGNMIKKIVMGGAEYAASAKTMTVITRVAELVAKDEGGIGGLGKGFVDNAKLKTVETQRLERPLGFITIGAPSPKVQQVINAFKTAAQ